MMMLNISKLRGLEVLWPGERLIETYGRLTEPSLEQVHRCEVESETLTELRQALLPKLLSG